MRFGGQSAFSYFWPVRILGLLILMAYAASCVLSDVRSQEIELLLLALVIIGYHYHTIMASSLICFGLLTNWILDCNSALICDTVRQQLWSNRRFRHGVPGSSYRIVSCRVQTSFAERNLILVHYCCLAIASNLCPLRALPRVSSNRQYRRLSRRLALDGRVSGIKRRRHLMQF